VRKPVRGWVCAKLTFLFRILLILLLILQAFVILLVLKRGKKNRTKMFLGMENFLLVGSIQLLAGAEKKLENQGERKKKREQGKVGEAMEGMEKKKDSREIM